MSTRSVTETIASLIKWPSRTKVGNSFTVSGKGHLNKKLDQITSHASAAPTALSLAEIVYKLPNLFPRGISESVKDYHDVKLDKGESFQQDLLMTLPFYRSKDKEKYAEVIRTPVDDEGTYINEFVIKPVSAINVPPQKLKHLVFVHGYGAGLGFFLKNFENISLLNGEWCIHAIDLPGYGFSSRCEFPFQYPQDTLEDVQDWFHKKLYRWFDKRGLLVNPENNIIMAHSLGAYLMSLYLGKYPDHFRKIVMCSPAGICHSMTKARLGNANPPWWYLYLWDKNISPFSLIRNSFHLGSKLTSGWSYRRFRKILQEGTAISKKQFEALHRYSYSIFNRPGSGEYLLSFVLRCGGDPRLPLEESLFKDFSNGIYQSDCKWLWLYGENDWMDVSGANRVSKILNDKSQKQKSRVVTIPSSGHHLYFDNYNKFNELIMNEMKDF